MTASLSQVLSGPMVIPWNGGHGSFGVVNLNTDNALTVILAGSDVPGETIVLANYGDSLSIDPVTLSTLSVSAASYPATCSYTLSPLVGLTASTVVVGVPVVYGFSNYQVATTTVASQTVSLVGLGGAPTSATKFWLESMTLSYSLDSGETFPPTASAWATVASGSLDPALVITPSFPVCSFDGKHLTLPSDTSKFSFAATANVDIYVTFLFSAQ